MGEAGGIGVHCNLRARERETGASVVLAGWTANLENSRPRRGPVNKGGDARGMVPKVSSGLHTHNLEALVLWCGTLYPMPLVVCSRSHHCRPAGNTLPLSVYSGRLWQAACEQFNCVFRFNSKKSCTHHIPSLTPNTTFIYLINRVPAPSQALEH